MGGKRASAANEHNLKKLHWHHTAHCPALDQGNGWTEKTGSKNIWLILKKENVLEPKKINLNPLYGVRKVDDFPWGKSTG